MMIDRNPSEQTPAISLQELIDEFEFLGDQESQMDYLIDLGLELSPLAEAEKTEANRVHGCQSNVWMVTRFDPETHRLSLQAESDAMIVSGLIAVLLACYQGKTAAEILEFDILNVFQQLGIDRHISPQRKNGLNGMVNRVREAAHYHQLQQP